MSFVPLRREEEEGDLVSLPSSISGEIPYRKALPCRPEMLLPSPTLLLSRCFSWGGVVLCPCPQLCPSIAMVLIWEE